MKYCVDIVLCIDSTGSMAPVIEDAKAGALRFHEDLFASMSAKDKKVDVLRVKVISYRDYYFDGAEAMIESPFYKLPDQRTEYENFIGGISAGGGDDEPESGLEALALAMNSDWTHEGDKQRQVICLWTDASTHRLEGHSKGIPKPSGYPKNMPLNYDELLTMWNTRMNKSTKRLLLFAPDAYAWSDINNQWDNTLHYVSQAGAGLKNEDEDYKFIIEAIANSIKLQ